MVNEAVAMANAAAARAGVEVRMVDDLDAAREVSELCRTVWAVEEGPGPMPVEVVWALAHAGSYVAAAHDGDRVVGAAIAFVAPGDAGRTSPRLHSHIAAVAPGHQGRGIGLALKLHQRGWALGGGWREIEWTFDPLIRRNGYFNLSRLGAVAVRYLVDFYGAMSDGINAGDASDRLLVAWDLTGGRAHAAALGALRPPDLAVLERAGAAVVLRRGERGEPVLGAAPDGEVRLAWVPEDVTGMRATDPAGARAWRLAAREVLGAAISDGFVIDGMTADGWYVARRHEPATRA